MKRLALSSLVATFLVADPAAAGQPVSLKAHTLASGPVTLGDLFEGAGRAGHVVVGPASQGGANVVLDAASVQRTARLAGLDWDNPQGIRRIVVRGGPAQQRAGAMAQVLTYARNINPGEVIAAEDLTWGDVAAFAAPQDAPRDADIVIGKAAKKPLRAGAAVSSRDLDAPQVIKRDDLVQVTYRAGGVTLTLQGKAMQAATVGQAFSVQNSASKKTIEAVAVGPGRAIVGPEAEFVRSNSLASLR